MTLAGLALLAVLAADKPKIIVMDLTAGSGVEATVARSFTSAIATELGRRGVYEVVSTAEIASLLTVERQRQLLGCSDEATSCLAELGGALGARFIFSGALTRLGEAWSLTMQTVDSTTAKSVGRATQIAASLEALTGPLPYGVAEASGLPPPPEQSRVAPLLLIGAGAAAVVGGGLVSLQAMFRQGELKRELELADDNNPTVLKPLRSYQELDQSLRLQQYVGLGVVGAGVALGVLGAVLYPRGESTVRLTLVPSQQGGLLVLGGRLE